MPAWELLPNERYWKIGRPHGGIINPGVELKWATIMTSRGCPFSCSYCHIAEETEGSKSGNIGKFRIKSDERVKKELNILKNEIGVKQVFISDDSIFGMKRRAIRLLKSIIGIGLSFIDVNGINMVHLLKKSGKPGWLIPDEEVISLLAEVGFKDLVIPFESVNPRVQKKWNSNKVPLTRFDPVSLIKMIQKYKIKVGTNYMIGFPDETREEIETTINFGKKMKDSGINYQNFTLVMPVPGTPIFDYCIKSGQLPKDYNPDKFQWTKSSMTNLAFSQEKLEVMRQEAWESCNTEEFKNSRKKWDVGVGKFL
jgi:radical SAM superfamily enzyme YgiQ (UPF0313 family)